MRIQALIVALPILLATGCDAPDRGEKAHNSVDTAGDPSEIDKDRGEDDGDGDGDGSYEDGYDDDGGYEDGYDDDGYEDDGDDDGEDDGDDGEDCTRTQGYWKNHPNAWPEDATDAALCEVDWMTWLQTPTAAGEYGEHWTLLAHQYIAAKLNYLSGAEPSDEVADALQEANALLTACAPVPSADEASDLATTLDQFNNGAEGTNHCDDDETGDDGEPGDDDGDDGDGDDDGDGGMDSADPL